MKRAKVVDSEPAPRLVDVDDASFDKLPCCGIKNSAHPGRREKGCWLQGNAKYGLRAKTLLAPGGQPAGYIEYVPGEFAWRGVDAAGYMFIHCLWVYSSRYQGRGWGRFMLDACLQDAKKTGKNGVAVMVREGPWLADRRLFVANGFEVVDTAPPDYELLFRKFDGKVASPSFRRDWEKRLRQYGRGLTIIRSAQCPHTQKFAADIAEAAEKEYGLEPNVIELHSPADAQNAPTPYAVFAVIHDGHLIADHQISGTRFRNIMRIRAQ